MTKKNAMEQLGEIMQEQLDKQAANRKAFQDALKDHSFSPAVGEILSLVNERNHYTHRGMNPMSSNTIKDMEFCASQVKEVDKRIQMLLGE